MKKLMYLLAGTAIVVGLGLGTGPLAEAQGSDASEDCAVCHEEIAADFEKTVHAISERGAPSCVTCHGNGEAHMEEGGDASLIGKPEGRDGEVLCLSCHRDTATMFSKRSVHSANASEYGKRALRELPSLARRLLQQALRSQPRPRWTAVRLLSQPARRPGPAQPQGRPFG